MTNRIVKLGALAVEPEKTDRLSTRYLIALGARMVREVAELATRADAAKQSLASLSIDPEIRFASADDRAQFTAELQASVLKLAAKYRHATAPSGRWHRLIVAAYPRPSTPPDRPDRPDRPKRPEMTP